MDRGYGLTVSVKKLNTLAQDLEKALKRILGEPSFKTSAERISHIMRAHRLTPAEKAAGKSVLSCQHACLIHSLVLSCCVCNEEFCMQYYACRTLQ